MSSDFFSITSMVLKKIDDNLVVKIITRGGKEMVLVTSRHIPDFNSGDVLTLEFKDDQFLVFDFVKDKV